MITFAKMQIILIVNIISPCCYDDWRDGAERTLLCSRKTWNPTSLTMEVNFF